MNVGDYALYLGWSGATIAQVKKVTAKQVKLKDSRRVRIKRKDEILASFPDALSAERLRDALNGAIGQREERVRKARVDFDGRRAAAFEAYEKVEARLLASAIEAASAGETEQIAENANCSGSTEGESAVGDSRGAQ